MTSAPDIRSQGARSHSGDRGRAIGGGVSANGAGTPWLRSDRSSSAVEGLRLLALQDFRGVISDFRTPGGITGSDVHDWLGRHRPEMASRIIFITGDTASDETIALLALAGTPCVEKPFRLQQLMEAVEKTIGKP